MAFYFGSLLEDFFFCVFGLEFKVVLVGIRAKADLFHSCFLFLALSSFFLLLLLVQELLVIDNTTIQAGLHWG